MGCIYILSVYVYIYIYIYMYISMVSILGPLSQNQVQTGLLKAFLGPCFGTGGGIDRGVSLKSL